MHSQIIERGIFNTSGCKFIEETLWHIFVWGLYMSCILISQCKERVKYSSGVSSHWLGLNVERRENRRHDFFFFFKKPCTNGTRAHLALRTQEAQACVIRIRIHDVCVNLTVRRSQHRCKAAAAQPCKQDYLIKKHTGLTMEKRSNPTLLLVD